MTISLLDRHGGVAAARHSDRATGIALMTGSAVSSQLGAATAALAFPVLGPVGVVAVRQWVACAVLLGSVRPRFRSFTGEQWRPVLALALIFAIMNLSLYGAIARIGLGLAMTLEFLGPLSVALLASRRVLDLGCALVAGAAVVVLVRPQPSTDYAGIALALLAASCWAGYILVNRVMGRRLPGVQGPAAAATLSALLYVPVGIWALASHPVTGVALARAASAGRAVLGGPDGRRPARAAAGSGQVLRRLHEHQPGVRGRGRRRDPGPVAGAGRMARDRRHRHRQRGQRQHRGPRWPAPGRGQRGDSSRWLRAPIVCSRARCAVPGGPAHM